MAAFPQSHIVHMVQINSKALHEKEKRELDPGELLKFFVVVILGTRYKFGKRPDLRATEAQNRLMYMQPEFEKNPGISQKIQEYLKIYSMTSGMRWFSAIRVIM
jgi:hypothetical protein